MLCKLVFLGVTPHGVYVVVKQPLAIELHNCSAAGRRLYAMQTQSHVPPGPNIFCNKFDLGGFLTPNLLLILLPSFLSCVSLLPESPIQLFPATSQPIPILPFDVAVLDDLITGVADILYTGPATLRARC